MKKPIILLSFKQLCYFGVHIGHDMSNYVFLSSWIFLGWYKKIFVINLYKTCLNLRFAVSLFNKCGSGKRPVIFVCMGSVFGPMVARYSFVSGEVFNIYWWVFGTLTNFRHMMGWNQLIIRLMMRNRHKLRFRDKKKLASFFGLLNHRRRPPRAGFVPSVLDNLGPVDEFLAANLPCVGIVDSNVPSWGILMPVPGNDDSAVCINFYCYLLTRSLLAGKLSTLLYWRMFRLRYIKYPHLYPFKRKLPRLNRNVYDFIFMYSNIYRNYNQDDFFKVFNETRQAEIPLNISIAEAINFWLKESKIVEDFSIYRGELYNLISEKKIGISTDMQYDLV